jgi:hypothetical protein
MKRTLIASFFLTISAGGQVTSNVATTTLAPPAVATSPQARATQLSALQLQRDQVFLATRATQQRTARTNAAIEKQAAFRRSAVPSVSYPVSTAPDGSPVFGSPAPNYPPASTAEQPATSSPASNSPCANVRYSIIQSTDPAGIGPDQWFLITGCNFGSRGGRVLMTSPEFPSDGTTLGNTVLDVAYWSDTQIQAHAPENIPVVRSGYKDISVAPAGAAEGRRYAIYFFDDREKQQPVISSVNISTDCQRPFIHNNNDWSSADTDHRSYTVHHAGLTPADGCHGTDVFYAGQTLASPWYVEYVSVYSSRDDDFVDAYVTVVESHEKTNNPTVRIQWLANPGKTVEYTVTVYAKGPRGTSP